MVSSLQIYGLSDEHIDYASLEAPVHRELVEPLRQLRQRARENGFELQIASGFRDFERQLLIWNQKAEGKRPVFDNSGNPIDLSSLNEWQQVQAILRWSALPGTSRHHWGSDIDIFDRAAVSADYQVQLSPQEVADDGPFGALHGWLDGLLSEAGSAYFRPYAVDANGVAPERWHLSFSPLAIQFESQFSAPDLIDVLGSRPLALKDAVLANLDEILARFVTGNFYSA